MIQTAVYKYLNKNEFDSAHHCLNTNQTTNLPKAMGWNNCEIPSYVTMLGLFIGHHGLFPHNSLKKCGPKD